MTTYHNYIGCAKSSEKKWNIKSNLSALQIDIAARQLVSFLERDDSLIFRWMCEKPILAKISEIEQSGEGTVSFRSEIWGFLTSIDAATDSSWFWVDRFAIARRFFELVAKHDSILHTVNRQLLANGMKADN